MMAQNLPMKDADQGSSKDAIAYDAIIIGAGHNGLTTAAYLAKAGLRTLVVERRGSVGGAASTEDIFPGFRVDTGGRDAGLFLPQIVADLSLENYGLRWIEPPALVFAPQPDGKALTLWRDPQRTVDEIARFSQKDAQRYPDFLRLVSRFSSILGEMMALTPPTLPELRSGELLPWLGTALRVKRLGDHDMMEFMRSLPMPVEDFLDEWFESGALKAAIGAGAVTGSFLGPKSSGTVFTLLYQDAHAGKTAFRSSRFVQGGTGCLSEALAEAARQRGAKIRMDADVRCILIEEGRAIGIELASGEQIRARCVVSSADPVHTFFGLVGAPQLEVRTVREVKNIRLRASLSRVNLAVSHLPAFAGATEGGSPERLGGHILICPSLEYLERAYDQAKYGNFTSLPMLDLTIPTVNDPGLAPGGAHLLCINFYTTPYSLSEGDWDSNRERLQDITVQTLEGYAPGLRDSLLHSQVLTPLDLERQFGLTGGDIYHGQMGLDQVLMTRPIPGSARYRTPVEGLYLCGAGSHPGGGVTGAPGYNAAREILKDLS